MDSIETQAGWSIHEMAIETGLDRVEVRKHLVGATPVGEKAGHPTYLLRDLVRSLKRGADNEVTLRTAAANARQAEAAADNEEMKRDTAMGNMLNAEQVFAAWEEMVTPAKQRLQGLPSKLQSAAGLTAEQTSKVAKEVDDLLNELNKGPDYKKREIDDNQ